MSRNIKVSIHEARNEGYLLSTCVDVPTLLGSSISTIGLLAVPLGRHGEELLRVVAPDVPYVFGGHH